MKELRLQTFLAKSRREIEIGLAEAEAELAEVEARRAELVGLIAVARAALGNASDDSEATPSPDQTLHDAVAQVLRERGNAWTTAKDLAAEINSRGLYHKRDRSPIELNQIHARTKNYSHMFEKSPAGIRLRNDGQT